MTEQDLLLTIAVGSKNKAKNSAVARAYATAFPNRSIKIVGYDVASGISEQPTTDEESIEGATNRAIAALALNAEADYGVGLEGNTVTISGQMFLHGWVAIKKRGDETLGIGHSSGLALPKSLQDGIDAGQELGPLMQTMLDDKANEIRHTLGTNGVLSAGLYTREQEFEDATLVALPRFILPDYYL